MKSHMTIAVASTALFVLGGCSDSSLTSPADLAVAGDEVAASGWTDKVVGGGELTAGGTTILNQVSVTFDEDSGKLTGQVEYDSPNNPNGTLKFHGVVTAAEFHADGVEICGDITNFQDDTDPFWTSRSTFQLAIKDVDGGDDRLRVNLDGSAIDCANGSPQTSFPAVMVEGDYRIREK